MLDNENLKGKKVLVRVDFNVPLNSNLEVTDNTRIMSAIPTIKELLDRGATVILMSHLGRPLKDLNEDGSIKSKYSMKNIIPSIESALGGSVFFISDPIPDKSPNIETKDQSVYLLENVRFYKGEEKGDPALAEQMSRLGEYYVNDAFGAAHRAHASTTTVANFFDDQHKSFGHLMEREVKNISKVLGIVDRPFCAIVGGAKVSDKIALLENLLTKVDYILVGGGMAFTFIKALGGKIGSSICEVDKLDFALELLQKAKENNVEIILPIDIAAADSFSNEAEKKILPADQIPEGWSGLDIGPGSIQLFEDYILKSKTILWNGPAGVFEFTNFANGTLGIASAIAKATKNGAFSIVGGGDSVAAINHMGLEDEISFVSTGGGAMLEMIEGKILPGIAAMPSAFN